MLKEVFRVIKDYVAVGDTSADTFFRLPQERRHTLIYGTQQQILDLMALIRKEDELRQPGKKIVTRQFEELCGDYRGLFNPKPKP